MTTLRRPWRSERTDIRNTLNGILVLRVEVFMSPVRLFAVAIATTHSIIPATSLSLWPTKGPISLASDVLIFTGSGVVANLITVDFGAETVQEAGFAAVEFSGVETLNVDANWPQRHRAGHGWKTTRSMYPPTGADAAHPEAPGEATRPWVRRRSSTSPTSARR